MLASDAKLSASRGFESQCRRFAFSFGVHIQRARLARLALAAGRELETDYIDTGFLQFPYFFGALSLKGQRQEANAIQNGGGGGGGRLQPEFYSHIQPKILNSKKVWATVLIWLQTNGASEISGDLSE